MTNARPKDRVKLVLTALATFAVAGAIAYVALMVLA
jgi:hypothetical protein